MRGKGGRLSLTAPVLPDIPHTRAVNQANLAAGLTVGFCILQSPGLLTAEAVLLEPDTRTFHLAEPTLQVTNARWLPRAVAPPGDCT